MAPQDSARPAKTRRSPKGERRRGVIVDAAITEFSRNGYRATSLEAIAQAAGMSQAGLLHHYPSKEDLLHAVLTRLITEGQHEVHALSTDPDDGPLSYYRGLTAYNLAHAERMKLIALVGAEGLGEDHPAHAHMRDRYAGLRVIAAERVRAQRDSGTVASDVDPQLLGTLVLAVLDGMQLQWLYDHDVDFIGVLRELEKILAPKEG
jgi:AcrR family transcriptional regulator